MENWIVTKDELAEVIARARLESILVRYRGVTEGRFRAPAQDVPDLVDMLGKTGRYVRDMCWQSIA